MTTDPATSTSLSVPAAAEYLSLVRSVAGRVAQMAGFGFDAIEDAALATHEAAVLLIEPGNGSRLDVSWSAPSQGRLRIVVSSNVDLAPDDEMAWQIVQALTSSQEVSQRDGLTLIDLTIE